MASSPAFRLQDMRAASRAALRAPGLADAVTKAANDIAARARAGTDDTIVVTPHERKDRPGAFVTRLGSGAQGEAKDRALGSSI